MSTVWWPRKHTVAIDVETTDSHNTARLIQVGLAGDGWSESLLIDPETDMGKQPGDIPDVTSDEIQYIQPFEAHAQRLHDLLKNKVVVAHNAAVEKRHLQNAFERVGMSMPPVDRFVCTLKLCRQSGMPGPHNLKHVCDMLNIEFGTWHNAMDDAVGAWRLYVALINRHPELRRYFFAEEFECKSRYFINEPWLAKARLRPPPR